MCAHGTNATSLNSMLLKLIWYYYYEVNCKTQEPAKDARIPEYVGMIHKILQFAFKRKTHCPFHIYLIYGYKP